MDVRDHVRDWGRSGAHWAYLLPAILAVAIVLRVFELTSQSLWLDEGLSLIYSSGGVGENLSLLFSSGPGNGTQPLYFVILGFWRELFGSSDVALRGLSVIIGVLTVGAIYRAGRTGFGGLHGLWAAAITATAAFAVYYSQEVRPYALLTFTSALALWTYVSVARADRVEVGQAILFALAAALLLATSLISAIMLTALAIADLVVHRRFRRWLAIWGPATVVCLPIVIGISAVAAVRLDPGNLLTSDRSPVFHVAFVVYGLTAGPTLGPPISALRSGDMVNALSSAWHVLVPFTLAGAWIVWRLWPVVLQPRRTRLQPGQVKLARVLLLALLITLCVGTLHVAIAGFDWLPRRAAYLFPLLVLVLPLALAGIRPSRGSHYLSAAPLALLIALNLVSLHNYFFEPAYQRDDYRAVADVTAGADTHTVPVILEGVVEVLRHYGDTRTRSGQGLARAEDFPGELSRLTEGAPRVMLIINREWDFEERYARTHATSYRDDLAGAYRLVDKQRFIAISVYTYERVEPASTAGSVQ